MGLPIRKTINFVSFYLAWPFCVCSAAHGNPLLGPILCLPLVLVHFTFTCARAERRPEFVFMLTAAVLGFLLDSALWKLRLVTYNPSPWNAPWAPLWIVTLWATFANAFYSSLSWLARRWYYSLIFGVVGGPLGFFAAQRLGALFLHPDRWKSILALSLSWGCAVPFLLRLRKEIYSRLRTLEMTSEIS